MRFLIALVVLVATAPVLADEYLRPADPIPDHPEVTFIDLLKQVVTDLSVQSDGTASGTSTIPLRNLVDGTEALLPEPIEISSPMSMPFRSGGEEMTLVYASLGHNEGQVAETVLLALYDRQMRLVDAADVGVFENNWADGVISIGRGDDVVRLASEHFNSSEGFDATLLVYVREHELTLMDAIYTYSARGDGYTEEQSLSLAVKKDRESAHWPLSATLHATRTVEPPTGGEDPPAPQAPPYDRTATVTYAWSASIGGYVADGDAIKELNAEMAGTE